MVISLGRRATLSFALPKCTLSIAPFSLGTELTKLLLLGITEGRKLFVFIKP
jgi:hypothetical protein